MRSPSNKHQETGDQRTSKRPSGRSETAERHDGARAAAAGDPPVEQRSVVTSMVDALEDILRWERASERALRVAAEGASTTSVNDAPASSN